MSEESMIERVARAMCAANGIDPDATGYGMGRTMPEGTEFPLWRAQEKAARAAIEAMREPTEAMVETFYEESYKTHPEDRFDVDTFPKLYGALIDKALT